MLKKSVQLSLFEGYIKCSVCLFTGEQPQLENVLFKNVIIYVIRVLMFALHCLGITLHIFAVYVSHIRRFLLQIKQQKKPKKKQTN